MKKYLLAYITTAEKPKQHPTAKDMADMLTHIQFFQHERLVHLLVTLAVAILVAMVTLFAVGVSASLPLLIMDVLLVVLLIPYLAHYYTLENGVQKLYRLYDHLKEQERTRSAE